MFKVPEQNRVISGKLASTSEDGNNGYFIVGLIQGRNKAICFNCIASDGAGWEHVSVTLNGPQNRTPTWSEMCQIKNIFWDEEDCVIQYHPPKSLYVNNHPYCLHLWRKIGFDLPIPPIELIGIKE